MIINLVLFILNKILQKVGCQVFTFETGEEILRNLEINTYDTAIIFFNLQDINMKKIILTGSPSEMDKIRAEKCGADYYIVKPFPSKKLIELVTHPEKFFN